MNKIKYPEVYYPYFFEKIAESEPELQKPLEPQKPILPIKPEKGQEFTGCLLIPVALILLSFLLNNYLDFKIIAGFILLSLISIFFYKTGKWDNQSYHKKIEDYELEKRNFPKKIEEYENQVLIYKKDIDKYHDNVRKSLQIKNLLKFRSKMYEQLYEGDAIEFEPCDEEDDIFSGTSESFFYNYLLNIEGLSIFRHSKLTVGDTYYYPDFIAVVDSHGFYIDIEIDEPYESVSKMPIHYIDEYEDSVDSRRNEYFKECGWFVIRFAEEQIVKAPDECINFIRKFVNKIVSFSIEEPNMEFESYKWTAVEAETLALKDYRLGYLNEIK
jgi:hypothetical protein